MYSGFKSQLIESMVDQGKSSETRNGFAVMACGFWVGKQSYLINILIHSVLIKIKITQLHLMKTLVKKIYVYLNSG